MTSPDPIQTQLIAARRSQILDAATKVFADKGFHPATIKQIAREAGVADGTIYNYFANKSDLLLGLLDRINESSQREAQFAAMDQANFETFFRHYLRHRMDVLKANTQLFQAVLPAILVDDTLRQRYYEGIIAPTYALAERYFKALQDNGTIRALETDLLLRAVSSLLLGLPILGILGDTTIDDAWDRLPDLLSELILHGILPRKEPPYDRDDSPPST